MRAADQLHRSAHKREAHGPRQHSGGGPETDGAADERGQRQWRGCGWPAATAETVCIHLQHGHRYRVSCQVIRSSQVLLLYSSPRKTWAPHVNCKTSKQRNNICVYQVKRRNNICMYQVKCLFIPVKGRRGCHT